MRRGGSHCIESMIYCKKASLSQIINLECSMTTLRIDKMVRTPR
jgi:hypothetical protein